MCNNLKEYHGKFLDVVNDNMKKVGATVEDVRKRVRRRQMICCGVL